MDDLTANVGTLYAALQQLWTDLNHMAHDFHRALLEAGRDLKGPERYSYQGRRHGPPMDHAWLFADASLQGSPVATPAPFAAMYVLFEANEEQRKPGPPGRPELWFFLGSVQAPRLSPLDIWSYLKHEEAKNYDRAPDVGALSRYTYEDAAQIWHTLCVGHEIGAISTPEELRDKVVQPLLKEAARLGW